MKRHEFPSLAMRALILAIFCALVRPAAASSAPAALKAISVSTPGSGNQLQLRIDGAYSFNAVQAAPDSFLVDLMPATANHIAKRGEWSGGLFTGYRLEESTNSNHEPVVRVQVDLKHHQAFKAQRTTDGLVFLFGDTPALAPYSGAGSLPANAAPTEAQKPSSAAVPPTPSPGGPVEVSGLSIGPGPDGAVLIDVATTHPAPYHVMQLSGPQRLVVDLDGARQSIRQKTFAAQSALLSDVRVGQFRAKNPAVVRVVADLSGNPIFDVHAQPSGIRIELKPRVSATHPVTPTAAVEKAAEVASQTRAASASVAVIGQPTAAVAGQTAASSHQVARQPASTAPIHSEYASALPVPAGSKEAAAPLPKPSEQTPETLQAANAAKVIAGPPAANPEGGQGQVAGTMGPGAELPHYTGEPISLNLKDVDLKDFFRLIHEISGLNILIDPDVTGTVTLVLDNVPWDQALDIVLKNNGLGKSLEGNVLRISRVQTLTSEQETATKLVSAQEEAQPLVTRFIPINYAKATAIQTLLKTWVGGGALSKRGNVLVDDRTNTLIVSDIASQIPIIQQIIARLDTKTKQIQIEAQIILATKTFERDLTSALNNGIVNNSGTVLTGGATGQGASATATIPPAIGPGAGGPVNLIGQTSASGFGAYVLNNKGARYFLGVMIAAAENKTQAKTISSPKIITQNNVPGTVTQGVQIPIQTNINNTITIAYQAAALTMTVTPQVTADGHVFMNITINNASPGAVLTGAGPSINTQQATTQVLVADGGTLIFGGVTVNSANNTANYVPLIGQIPILGHLFKSTTRTSNDNELLFFVTPKVLPD